MKTYNLLSILVFALPVLCTGFSSFSDSRGGDVFAIYLNGRQVHRQYVHVDKNVKTLQLQSFSAWDKIEVFYSHCGHTGTVRVLTLRNENNELVTKLKFPDANGNNAMMGFYRRDLAKNKSTRLKVYYSSKELPEGTLLATIRWSEPKAVAKR